ncbi:MAG TPA: hypothetical protein VJ742_06865, partial [Nitrososphaera sp.]|nr:hypothetical protein [Nitrososphaera sp.]
MAKLSLGFSPAGISAGLRDNTSLVAKMAIMLGTIVLVYGSDLSVVFNKALAFSAGNITNYVLVIPILVLFVLHRKRKILFATAT